MMFFQKLRKEIRYSVNWRVLFNISIYVNIYIYLNKTYRCCSILQYTTLFQVLLGAKYSLSLNLNLFFVWLNPKALKAVKMDKPFLKDTKTTWEFSFVIFLVNWEKRKNIEITFNHVVFYQLLQDKFIVNIL